MILYRLPLVLLSTAGLTYGAGLPSAPPQNLNHDSEVPLQEVLIHKDLEIQSLNKGLRDTLDKLDSKNAQIRDQEAQFTEKIMELQLQLEVQNQEFGDENLRKDAEIKSISEEKEHLSQLLKSVTEQLKISEQHNQNLKNELSQLEVKLGSKRTFDLSRMKRDDYRLISHSKQLQRTGNDQVWSTVGITEPFTRGIHSIQFKLTRDASNQTFGVIPTTHFSFDGFYGGYGFQVLDGILYYQDGRALPCSGELKAGDIISITVTIPDDDQTVSSISITRNGEGLDTKPLPQYGKLNVPFIFAVSMNQIGDEIQIVECIFC